ncbi:isoleucine--tRNA ligase [Clostridium sp. 'deep sea']|uniref:isoleucine--tRNA ligase n=1 Tax=Clostridium sp. 'deep sea' TaxID=2779445 RepID=UPI0018969E28|nr:isoleucine--tRNA ligase [Clostridium sp. 'deep sea']QOR34080.1 isoleucine--tRNA ligase [Clostridium sp. 'deep sea']
MIFPQLKNESAYQTEQRVADYWDEINLLEKSITERNGAESFVFYEGPPTANGHPGIHHVISRTLKDTVCRYKTMQGYQVKRKAGWDTHGLPVEIEVEKQLKLSSKQDIEKYGLAEFNKKCRESVFSYEELWRKMTREMGYLIDLDDPYITLDNNYIESVWWILNEFHKKGFIYEGHKILPYCPRCGTGLASHEVAQGYKEIKSDTVVAKFKVKDEDAYFLAWTTTPWTLASNVTLAVNADVDYVKVRSEEDNTVYILAKDLASHVIKGDFQVLETFKGKDLEYKEYEQLMPFLKTDKKAFFVTVADYVTTSDGTGIVHTAPAFGQDDYETGRRYNLPVLQPVDNSGKYTATPWQGMFVMDADPEIIKYLRAEGKMYSKQRMEHNYPHCWRCKTPLLYYARKSWYIEITKIQDKLIEANNQIEWYPPYVGEKRFGNWLENLNDWALSRSRYWGTPLNIWRCDCGHFDTIGSRKELVERAIEDIDESIELHRPYVDDIHLTCEKCGKPMTRVSEVIDCWFDSGSMPFAQHHYPFENKDKFFEKLYPADYISEGIDQTRGWFYSLLAISVFLTGKASYKRVLVNDLILDNEGRKMSKSRGNTVDPFQMFEKYGADVLRWYLLYSSVPWLPKRFDEDSVKEVISKYFSTLKNVYKFFALYAESDNINPREFEIKVENRPEIDRWIISKYNNLVKDVNQAMDDYNLTQAVRRLQQFVNEDLSNWFIRRNRRRFWATELTNDKKSVYKTTYEVLVGISQLMAPISPFLAEELYKNLTGEQSVHLSTYPKSNSSLINELTEKRMDLVRDLVKLGRSGRESVKIKVRQPISQVLVDGKYESLIGDMVDLIKEELNVKKVVFTNELSQYMSFSLKPNFRVAGPMLGKNVGAFNKQLNLLNAYEIAMSLENGEEPTIKVADTVVKLNKELIQVNLAAREGFTVSMENNLFIILDTQLSQQLINEGLAREFVSKVQQMRKNNGYDVSDRISIYFKSTAEVATALHEYNEWVKQETLADALQEVNENLEIINLNGYETGIKLAKN